MAEVGTVWVSVMPTNKGFAAAMNKQAQAAGTSSGKGFCASFGSIVGGSALGNIAANAFQKIAGALSGSMDSAIKRVDTLNNFPKVMTNLGYGADEAKRSVDALSTGIDGMPTSLDGIVSMTQQLAPLCGGLDQATNLSLALNNMFLASGASTTDQARAMQQYTQMLSKGKPELMDWRTLMEIMPGQLNQVAEAMLGAGHGSMDLYEALKAGDVSMQDFNATVLRLNSEGANGFASFEQQARSATEGIGTAAENAANRTAKSIGKVMDHIGQANISGVINGVTSQFGAIADKVIEVWDGMVSTIDFAGFEAAFGGVRDALSSVFSNGDVATSFGQQVGGVLNMLIPAIQAATPAIQLVALAIKFAAENAMWLLPALLLVMGAFKLGSSIGTAGSFMTTFGNSAAAATPKVDANAASMLKLGVAGLALGAGIALACAGIALLVMSAIQLAQAGPMAAVALAGLVGVVALFALGAAALGPALTAGALGFEAFGTAVLMVGAGIMMVCAGFTLLSGALPTVAAFGVSAAGGIAALGGAMLIAAPGALLLGAALMLAGAGAMVAGAGMLVLTAGAMGAFVGLMLCSVPATILGPALLQAGAGAMLMGAALLIVAMSSIAAVPGLLALGAMIGGVALALGVAVPAFMGLSGALGGCAAALAIGAGSMQVIVVSCRMANTAALVAVASFNMVGTSATSMAAKVTAAGSRLSAAQGDLAFRLAAANSRIQASFNAMRLHIPSPSLGPMPHFSLRGKFDLQAGTVPTIDVNWYAKGGVFSHSSIIGVGEAGTEVVAPVDRLLASIERGSHADNSAVVDELRAIYALMLTLLQRNTGFAGRDDERFVKKVAHA